MKIFLLGFEDKHKMTRGEEYYYDEEDQEEEGEEECRNAAAGPVPLLELPQFEWRTCERIEKVASVVACTPSAELFFMQLMSGDEDFGFMSPGHDCYYYYRQRIGELRMKPSLLYSL